MRTTLHSNTPYPNFYSHRLQELTQDRKQYTIMHELQPPLLIPPRHDTRTIAITTTGHRRDGGFETGFLGNNNFSRVPSTLDETTLKTVLLCTTAPDYFLGECRDSRSQVIATHTTLHLGKPVIPPKFLFLPDRAGVKISLWILNIGSILNNLPSRVDPRLEVVCFFFM